jgi:hypothetical protein
MEQDRHAAEMESLRAMVEAIDRAVQSIAGLPSRWNGAVELADDVDLAGNLAFRAEKRFSCTIRIHVEALDWCMNACTRSAPG